MPKILALDTSTDACSVALHIDGQQQEDFRIIPRQHTKELLPMVQQMMQSAGLKMVELDAICVGRGPGSFAGIRIATGAAQGLAFAAQLPMLPVSTLESMALAVFSKTGASRIVTALDARMNEIYVACYEMVDGLPQLVGREMVVAPDQFVLPEGDWTAAGSGWRYLDDMSAAVQQRLTLLDDDIYPSAQDMLSLGLRDWNAGKQVAAEDALPVYLRDEVAWKKKDQQ
ncbi:tRNA (adenosine(37)-N6)-threonylcarbamoyltransferase complex dimerization subunit type 1 TsaB [Marinobacterium jannaschii]|uniref:tRNA (adenosine(37)-N6)-threonylcarbamoyltransferase complex dimerization subunit type 1 TsaB n=1 Tax=Marinobacterium jannaschii TaxID=64970 RepID=UPI00047F3BE3|nr:tRNA (adenosine(37)-N6)-threonylcarbamoyltransferase complex dimerization subunit type 1 TsaB [Marinobacterium jannaschii]